MDLNGSHTLVTGASRGIGAALTRELTARGASVTALARSRDALEQVASQTGASTHVADLSDAASIGGILAAVEAANGPVDLLINNAALGGVGEFLAMDESALGAHVHANLLAPMTLAHQALPGMIQRRHGGVVFVSSVAGEMATRNAALYASTKAGLSNFAQTLRREVRRDPVNVLLVILGEVHTAILDDVRADPVMAEVAKRVGKLKALTPEQVATGIADAVERDRSTLVLPPAARPLVGLRNVPSRLMDAAMTGVS